jgi:hypothetical protein
MNVFCKTLLVLVVLSLAACVRTPSQQTAAPGVGIQYIANQVQRIEDGDNTCYLYIGDNHRSALSCVKSSR